jgi:murein DD-endopeptidase MepM/ murein hydrolase activator NlpD
VVEVVHSAVGFGNHVLIHHGGDMVTLYGHLLATVVVNGQAVAAGAVIGFEGSTGNSSGPHLHFEVRQGVNPVPPRTVFPGIFGPGPSTSSVGTGPTRTTV